MARAIGRRRERGASIRFVETLLFLSCLLGAAPLPAQSAPPATMARWAGAEVIRLWPDVPPGGGFARQLQPSDAVPNFITNVAMPELRVFRPARPNGRILLSIPGGAYRFVSIANEGVDVAEAMTAKGYTVFVLVYRLPAEGWASRADVPLQDAQRAMRVIRARASAEGLDSTQLYVVGFSAGGHLAATLATGFAEPVYPARDAVDRLDARPTAVALIYPVISHRPGVGHAESSRLLLGANPSAAQIARRSPALHVTADTPPAFVLHAIDDPAVPVENSMLMIDALRAAQRPVEAHLFEEGGHGFGLGSPSLPVGHWIDLLAAWIDRQHSKSP